MLKYLDLIRIIAVAFAFFFGYQIGFRDGYDPQAQMHFMIPVIVVAIAGLSGFESIFSGRKSAELKGFETGSSYQIQSAIALLSYALAALMVYFCNWGIKAELVVLFAFLFFFFFFGCQSRAEGYQTQKFQVAEYQPTFITLLLIAGLFYPVLKALQSF